MSAHLAGRRGCRPFREFISAGDVLNFESSEAGGDTARRAAHAVHPVLVLQNEYSLFERDVEQFMPPLGELSSGSWSARR